MSLVVRNPQSETPLEIDLPRRANVIHFAEATGVLTPESLAERIDRNCPTAAAYSYIVGTIRYQEHVSL